MRFKKRDFIFLALILAFGILYALKFYKFSNPYAEDALMLMRYARNFAEGHGFVWNIGGKPVDGGTDFLSMITLGFVAKFGFSMEKIVFFLGIVSHFITVLLVYFGTKRLVKRDDFLGKGWPVFASLLVMTGPAFAYIASGFMTPFFALFGAATFYMATKLIDSELKEPNIFLFSLLALLMALTRPEGAILAVLMALAIVYINGFTNSLVFIKKFLIFFGSLGLIYFVWRWAYFGYPLPNPFYKKGEGIYFNTLYVSIKNTIELSWWFGVLLLIGLFQKESRKITAALFIIFGFTAVWILLSNEMNYLMRFQYILLPIGAITSGWVIKDIKIKANPVWLIQGLSLAILIGGVIYQNNMYTPKSYADGRYHVAEMLNQYKGKGYTMAVTEAGQLPYYSEWKSIDVWGLNDQWIAHNGIITKEYLDRDKPEIIMFHARFSPLTDVLPPKGDWNKMVTVLKEYAEENGYVLAADFGDSPYDTHYYYVKKDFPDSKKIIGEIREIDYTWYLTDKKCINFAVAK